MKNMIVTAFMIATASCVATTQRSGGEQVQLDLQSGFQGQVVHISCDGKPLFNEEVTTDPSTGLANSISIQLPRSGSIVINLKSPQISTKLSYTTSKGRHFGVRLEEHRKLVARQQQQPFVYD